MSTIPRIRPHLITTKEAAELLHVTPRTILNWIKRDAIPYVQLPPVGERREYRIPVAALLRSLAGNYDLARELERLDDATLRDDVTDESVLEALEQAS